MGVKPEVSSGGVIYRTDGEVIEVCLIAVQDGTRWQLPKGHVDEDESLEETALREVQEETGLVGRSLGRIDKIDYWYWSAEGQRKIRHYKIVYFFLLEHIGGTAEDHDFEVDAVEWIPIDEAIGRLTYDSERDIVRRAKHMIAEKAR